MKRALEVDPLSLIIASESADPDRYQRKYDVAIAQERKVLELDPNFWVAHYLLAFDYAGRGEFNPAVTEAERAVQLSNGSTVTRAMLGYAYARAGERQRALGVARELAELRKERFVSAYYLAVIYAGLEDHDACIRWLEESYREKSIMNDNDALANPLLDPVRSDARYIEIIRRLGLAQ